MLRNYFIVAFRNIRRAGIFSLINITGLAIGISASLVIFLLVQFDFSFDKFHKDGSRIYRIVSDFNFSGQEYHNSGVPSPMGKAVKKEVTGLEQVVAFRTWNEGIKVSIPLRSRVAPTVYKDQRKIAFVDADYFSLINYQWLAGSPGTSLAQPYQVVLTEANAGLYFPRLRAAEIIGREVVLNDTIRTTVTGIVKDLTQNTDFTFKTFISRATLESTSLKPEDWDQWSSTNSASQLLVKLSRGSTTQKVLGQITGLYKKYNKPAEGDNSKTSYQLQPLTDIHFNNNYDNFDQRLAHMPTLYGLLAVAAFLLLLGCINFINLTTAQASQRAKEIGIRKTMGSSKKQLIFQFLSESFLLTLVATIVSIALTPLLLKIFSDFIPEGLHFDLINQPFVIVFLCMLMIAVSLLSGFYPALILASYRPVLVLKNQAYVSTGKTRSAWLRKTLTVSQFVIAQVFIIATILVSKQISYSLSKDMGFKKDAIVYFNTNYYDTIASHKLVLMNKLRAIPGVTMVSLATDPPSINSSWSGPVKYKDGKKEVQTDVQFKFGDTNYIKLYALKLVAGRNLRQSDTANEFIINETYAHVLGFTDPQEAIGKYIEWSNKRIPIIGVVRDFLQKSVHETVRPLAIGAWTHIERTVNIALQPQNAEGTAWKTTIAEIGKAFREVYPEDDLKLTFVDEYIAGYYKSEQNVASLLRWATALAIFISCLGLLGLIIYISNQRTKEIGIRKVVGASVQQIVVLLSKDFLKLVAIAFIIATPLAWWAGHKWLENFAYRTALDAWIFISGGAIMLTAALFILCIRTFKAASANPVKSLRSE